MLHFVVIGIALFIVHAWVAPADNDGRRIIISQSAIDDLASQHRSTWGRSPNEVELGHLVETYVHDEILYREGMRLGLDADDQVIKRRVRQKLEIIAEEANADPSPTDADLSGYLARHPEKFVQPGLVTFQQIMFDGARSVDEINRSVATARRAIVDGADPLELGELALFPGQLVDASLDLVARDFGSRFARQLQEVPLGQWVGPVPSAFGMHLVCVTARTPPAVPQLDAVRSSVEREWEAARRTRALDETYRRLRQRYEVVFESIGDTLPDPPASHAVATR